MERVRTTHIPPKIFSYFFPSQSLFISEGILAYFPLSSLVDPNHLGEPPGVADGEGRRAEREGRTHYWS
jgi:hypothetical protein